MHVRKMMMMMVMIKAKHRRSLRPTQVAETLLVGCGEHENLLLLFSLFIAA